MATSTWEPVLYLVGSTGSTGPTGTFSFSGATGAILYSPDGTSVTGSGKLVYKEDVTIATTFSIQGYLTGITYGSIGGYVAVGEYNSGLNMNTRYLSSPDGEIWTEGTGPSEGVLFGVTYGPSNGYVAVGKTPYGNTLCLKSTNGKIWTAVTVPNQGFLNGIAYGPTHGYVAIGIDTNYENSIYLTSSNGESWTGGTGPIQGQLNGITYDAAGGYVAVGATYSGTQYPIYLSSSNGVSWTGGTMPIQGALYGIAYGPTGGYVAVGFDTSSPVNTLYLSSPDGVTWTGGTGPIQGELYAIAYGPTDGYVAVGYDNSTSPVNTIYLSSSDGVSWTSGTGPIEGYLQGIAYNTAGGYVAVGSDRSRNDTTPGNTIYLTSPDAVSWTGSDTMGNTTAVKTSFAIDALIDNSGSTGAPGQLLTAGPTGSGLVWTDPPPNPLETFSGATGAILYSPDGLGVTGSSKLVYKEELVSITPTLPGIMRGITYNSVGGYVGVRILSFEPPYESFILSSSNGQSWIGGTGPIQAMLTGITYGSAGGYVAVGGDGSNTLYLTSSNGTSWTSGTGPIQGLLSAVTYGDTGGYVAVGYDSNTSDSIYLTSLDGQSWTGGTGPIQGELQGITYDAAGGYVAVGYDSQNPRNSIYLTSSNGQSWTGGTGPIQGELRGITYGSTGGYVAVGSDSGDPQNTIYLSSSDGVSWTGGTGPVPGVLFAVTYDAAGGYVAVGNTQVNGGFDSFYLTSSNGVSWIGGTGPVPGGLFGVTYGGRDGYMAVGTKLGTASYDALYLISPDGQSWTGGSVNAAPVEVSKSSITIDALIDNVGSTGAPGQVLTAGPTGAGLVWADGVTNIYDTLYASTFTVSTIGSTTGPITVTSDLYVPGTISTHSIVVYGSNTLVSEGSAFFSTLTSQEVVLPYNYTTSNNFAWTNQVTSCNAFSNINWTSVASDSTGSNLAACVDGGDIWTGQNTGSNWVWTAQSTVSGDNSVLFGLAWTSITSDSTGSNLAVAVNGGSIWIGQNVGGVFSWTDLSTTSESNAVISGKYWKSIASDSTGSNLVACVPIGMGPDRTIWTGHNTGSGWVWTDQGANDNGVQGNFWRDVASDSTGSNVCAINQLSIWTGQNTPGGWTWTNQGVNCNALSNNGWISITSDSTGSNVAAVVHNGTIWAGENTGAGGWVWTDLLANGLVPINEPWQSIAFDYTGSNLVGVQSNGTIWTAHKDSGVWMWLNQVLDCNALSPNGWQSVVFDSTGSNIAGVGDAGLFFTGVSVPGVIYRTQHHTLASTSNTLLYDGSVLPGILPVGGNNGDVLIKLSSQYNYQTSWTARNVFDTLYATTVSTSVIVDSIGSPGVVGKVLTVGLNGYGEGLVWADPTIPFAGVTGSILYSPDGVGVTGSSEAVFQEVLSYVPAPIIGYNVQAITNGAQGPIAVGYAGADPLWLRYDLATWAGGTGPIPGYLNGITYDAAGGYVAVGGTQANGRLDSLYLTSSDGVSWTGGTGPILGELMGITYDVAGGYVAVGYDNSTIPIYLSSSNGLSWTGGTGPIPGTLEGIAYSGDYGYVAVGVDGSTSPPNSIYLTSSDGLSWTGGTGPIPGTLRGITYDVAGGYVAVGYDSTPNTIYITSPDGVTWTGGTGPIQGNLETIAYTPNDGYLAVGQSAPPNYHLMSMTSVLGDIWVGNALLGTTGIYNTTITTDTLVVSIMQSTSGTITVDANLYVPTTISTHSIVIYGSNTLVSQGLATFSTITSQELVLPYTIPGSPGGFLNITESTSGLSNTNFKGIVSDSAGSNLATFFSEQTEIAGEGEPLTYDGNILTAHYNGSGWTWTDHRASTPALSNQNWRSITSDSTGSNIAAVANGGGIWTGKNNAGTWTWTDLDLTSSPENWMSIASDSTGSNLVAVSSHVGNSFPPDESLGTIWTGQKFEDGWVWTDQGTNCNVLSNNQWSLTASDSTGSNIVAIGRNQESIPLFWTGKNTGSDVWVWTDQIAITPALSNDSGYEALTSDSTGSNLATITRQDTMQTILTGKNTSGTWTWTDQSTNCNALLGKKWSSIASDSTGSNLVASILQGPTKDDGGTVWKGVDNGASWTWTEITQSNIWSGIATNSTGSKIFVSSGNDNNDLGGSIYESSEPTPASVEYHRITSTSNTIEFDGIPIGPGGTFSLTSGVTGSVLYSPDGVGVTGSAKAFYGESMVLTTAPIIGSLLAVTYDSAGGTIAVGFSGNDSLYLLHPTADTWTSGTGPIPGILSGITYGSAGGYVAVGSYGADTIYLRSSNGESWTGGTGPIQGQLNGITYGSTGGYVAVGYDSNIPPNSIYLTSPDGLSWTGGTGPIPGYLYGVTYDSAGGYVAVGFDNSSPANSLYLTSSDGLSWTGGTGPIPGNLYGITYGSAGGYVAVGYDNSTSPVNTIYLSSSDGLSWTGGTGPFPGELTGITYDTAGGYVAVGVDGSNTIYLTSSDGVSWTGGTGPIPGILRGITYTPLDGYLAVGYVNDGSYNNTTFMRSSVGLSWTGSAELINENILKSTISPDILVDNLGSTGAPGQVLTAGPTGAGLVWADPTITIAGTTGSILYSPDGVGVTGSAKAVFQEVLNNVPVPITNYYLEAITNGPEGPIAVGYDGPMNTLYVRHPDAATWIGGTGPIRGTLFGITYGAAGGYVAVGFDDSTSPINSIYLTSSNGLSWTGGTGPIPGYLYGITYGPTGGYVAVGFDNSTSPVNTIYLSSPDGVSWTGGTGPITGNLYGITYGPTGGYVAVGLDGITADTIYLSSPDGISWTGGTGPIPGNLQGITYDAAGGYVAVGYTYVNNESVPLYLSSSDGETWTGGTGPFLGQLKDVTYNAVGGYVAVGDDSTANTIYLTSTDGVTWTGGTGSILGYLTGITYTSNDGYLAVGYSSPEYKMMSMTSSNGDVWTSSAELGTTGIYHTSITIDTLVDSLGSTGAAGQVLTAGPTGGSLLWSLPTTPMGKMIRVDSVYGDDLLGSPGNHPYQTVTAAVAAASNAGPGHTIWVMPGTYNLSNGITIPTGCALRGSSTQTTIIQMCNVLFDTTLVTMGENTRVEDLTLIIHSTGNIPLTGIEFPGTTSVTGKLRTCVLTVNNSNASIVGVDTDVIGIKSSGTGTLGPASFSFNSLKGSTVNIYSNGGGNKRGILISASNTMTTRDMNIYVAAPADLASTGSYIGIETANSDGRIQCRSTTISGYTSDIRQSQGYIELGPGVDIVNKTAGGCNFTTYVYPAILYYGVKGTLRGSGLTTSYLWPGTASVDDGNGGNPQYPDSQVVYYRAQQKSVIMGMYATLASNAGSGHSATVTLQVNDSNTPFSLGFSNNTGPASNYYYDGSITLQRFDRLSVKLDLDTTDPENLAHDLSLQVDIF